MKMIDKLKKKMNAVNSNFDFDKMGWVEMTAFQHLCQLIDEELNVHAEIKADISDILLEDLN